MQIYEKMAQFHVKILGVKSLWDEKIAKKKPRYTGGPRYRGARYRGGLLYCLSNSRAYISSVRKHALISAEVVSEKAPCI